MAHTPTLATTLAVGLAVGVAAYAQWGAEPDSGEAHLKTGKELYEHHCAACHDPGPGHPGTRRMAGDFGEEQSFLMSNSAVNKDLVKFAARNGFNMMPPFRSTEISDSELDLIADHIVGGDK